MSGRQTNYQAQRARIKREVETAKILAGSSGVLASGGMAIAAYQGIPPCRKNPDVQAYMGLESRANSLREDIRAGETHPILRTGSAQNALPGMRAELGGVETQMAELGVLPDVMKYVEWSKSQSYIPSAFLAASLTVLLASLLKLRKAYLTKEDVVGEIAEANAGSK